MSRNTAERIYFDSRLESRAIPAAGGLTQWDFRGVDPRLGGAGGKHKYLVGIYLDIVLPVVSAMVASAVTTPFDYPWFLRRFLLKRGSDVISHNNLSGWDMFVRECCVGLGYPLSESPATIAANANATTTIRYRWYLPIGDDGQLASERAERFYHAYPLAAYVGQSGKLELEWDTTLNGSTGITCTAGTVQPTLVYVARDELFLPPDRRFQVVGTATTGSQRGIQLPGGNIESLVYAPRKVGGETLTDAIIDGEPYQFGLKFPRRDAAGPAQTAAAASNFPSYREQFLTASGRLAFDGQNSASTLNQILAKRIVPVWLPVGAKQTSRFFRAPANGMLLDVLNTSALTEGHRFLVGTYNIPDERDVDVVCSVLDIPKASLGRMPAVAEARPVGQGLSPSRRVAIGTLLTPGRR